MRWVMISGLPRAARKLMIWPTWKSLACAAVTGASTTMSPTAMVGVIEPEMIVITGCPKTTRWPSAVVLEPMAMAIVSTATRAITTVTVVESALRYQRRGLRTWPGLLSAWRVEGVGAVVTLICLLLLGPLLRCLQGRVAPWQPDSPFRCSPVAGIRGWEIGAGMSHSAARSRL